MNKFACCLLLWGCTNELLVLAPDRVQLDASASDAALARDGAPSDAGREPGLGPDGGSASSANAVNAFAHTCVIDDGGVSCWGDAQNEQFGVLGDTPRLNPVRLATGEFNSVCAGERHACALRTDGTLLCWGGNVAGQLGLGDRTARAQPTPLPDLRFAAVACGGEVTCALSKLGELYCWGDNRESTLGQGDAANIPNSTVPLRVARELRGKDISVGQAHACLVEQGGALYCWGRNTFGQTGTLPTLLQVRSPTRVDMARSYERVAAAQRHTCAVASDGKLFCWGDNRGALLGVDAAGERVNAPAQVGTSSDYQRVAANWFHTCAISRSGALSCWGRNTEEQLGLGDTTDRPKPTRVGSDSDWRVVTTGQFHTCGVRGAELYCWGDNREGQLGLGDLLRRDVPTRVDLSESPQ